MPSVDADVSVQGFDRISFSRAVMLPGRPAWRWRAQVIQIVLTELRAGAPVNNPLNAVHRGGEVGEYQRSFVVDTIGSNQFQLRMSFSNTAPHADVVERGRRRSRRAEVFSWTGHRPPGAIAPHPDGTSARRGTRHLERTSIRVVKRHTL